MAYNESIIITFAEKNFFKRDYLVFAYDNNGVFRTYSASSGESIQVEVSQSHAYQVVFDCEGTSTRPFSLFPGGVYYVEEDGSGLLGFKPKVTKIR